MAITITPAGAAPPPPLPDPGAIQITPGGPASLQAAFEAGEVQELRRTELQRVRSAASNWRTGLAALLALITTVSVVKGPDTVAGLDVGTRVAVAIFIGMALGTAGYGSFRAMRAAFGMPKLEQVTGNPGEVEHWRHQGTKQATGDLWWAIVLTFVTLASLAVAVGITWFASPPSVLAQVITHSDKVLCGSLSKVTSSGVTLQIKGSDVTVSMKQVDSIKTVSSCK